jgi:hypothetical protein
MVQPAPRMMSAPPRKRREVPTTDKGEAIGMAIGAAISVEKRHGKNR